MYMHFSVVFALSRTHSEPFRQFRVYGWRVSIIDVKVSRTAWSRDHFFGLGLGVTVIGFGFGLDLMRQWSRVSYVLVSWSESDHLLSQLATLDLIIIVEHVTDHLKCKIHFRFIIHLMCVIKNKTYRFVLLSHAIDLTGLRRVP